MIMQFETWIDASILELGAWSLERVNILSVLDLLWILQVYCYSDLVNMQSDHQTVLQFSPVLPPLYIPFSPPPYPFTDELEKF